MLLFSLLLPWSCWSLLHWNLETNALWVFSGFWARRKTESDPLVTAAPAVIPLWNTRGCWQVVCLHFNTECCNSFFWNTYVEEKHNSSHLSNWWYIYVKKTWMFFSKLLLFSGYLWTFASRWTPAEGQSIHISLFSVTSLNSLAAQQSN